MKLAELDLDTFMSTIVKANRLMSGEEICSQLLDAAVKDMPIIVELMADQVLATTTYVRWIHHH